MVSDPHFCPLVAQSHRSAIETNKTGNVEYETNIEARRRNNCCRGQAASITYSECVFVALVSQQAKRMRHAILSPVISRAAPYFSPSSHKRQDFRKTFLNIK
jgi:hypothetical protein